MNLKPWREIATPHQDVLKGSFVQAEFAADISRVHTGTATDEYQDPALFFQRTFITEGMAALLGSVLKRLAGDGGDPVIKLQTAFGGGKTHSLLAVMHMVSGTPAERLAGIPEVMAGAKVESLPAARVVVLDGTRIAPNQPREVPGASLHTLWGELAWQLGGADAYARVANADRSGTSPGKEMLAELINAHAPCVILIDELVAYLRQFEKNRSYTGGTYDSILSFVQALTEGIKACPTAVLLASLPESEREAGSEHGVASLESLESYFIRIQALWQPVSSEEAFEIVRRRLFTHIGDRSAADAVCDAFANTYVEHKDSLPGETQAGAYRKRLKAAYPIHPEVFDRLYDNWSSLPSFQRTRGVLKLMAKVIHRLWQDDNRDLMLLPGSFPLYDRDVRGELVTYLPAGWDPVVEHDVDGDGSEPADLDAHDPRFGSQHAARRVSRTLFIGSAPGSVNEGARGMDTTRVVLGCLQPGQQPHVFRDALGRLETRLTYLNKAGDRWWFDMRPNLRREMEERKRRFSASDVEEELRSALQRVMGTFSLTPHVFVSGADLPDDWSLRLAVLPPPAAWVRSGRNLAEEAAASMLRMRGDQPRLRQNRVLFLAADADQVGHLQDTARALMAWRSIEEDAKAVRITIDNRQQQQATQYREQTWNALLREIREVYKWLVAPGQVMRRNGTPGDVEWSAHALNPATPGLGKEIDRVLKENELVIDEWAPIHLHALLARWFWRNGATEVKAQEVWEKSCNYLYFPRLLDSRVLQATISAGASSRDFFGLASARDDDVYRGFTFGRSSAIYIDTCLLIEPAAAAEYEERTRPKPSEATGMPEGEPGERVGFESSEAGAAPAGPSSVSATNAPERMTRYFGTADLDPVRAALEFAKIVSELVEAFSTRPGSQVRLKVDIEARDPQGFEESTVRTVRENGKVLGVDGTFE